MGRGGVWRRCWYRSTSLITPPTPVGTYSSIHLGPYVNPRGGGKSTSLIRKEPPVGPYSSICPGPDGGPRGGGGERGTPVPIKISKPEWSARNLQTCDLKPNPRTLKVVRPKIVLRT